MAKPLRPENGAQAPDFTAVLKVGRYAIESDGIGEISARRLPDRLELNLSVDRRALDYALEANGLTRPGGATQMSDDFLVALPDWLRHWFFTTLESQESIEAMSTAEFLRWAETQSRDLDLYLAVPAVAKKIRAINNDGGASTKARLARIISGIAEGRPRRLPPPRVIYMLVRKAELKLRPVHAQISTSTNPAALWLKVKTTEPQVAALLESLGLHKHWFTDRERPRSQERTLWYMACELVAAEEKSTPATIAKMAGKVRVKLEPKIRAAGKRAWTTRIP